MQYISRYTAKSTHRWYYALLNVLQLAAFDLNDSQAARGAYVRKEHEQAGSCLAPGSCSLAGSCRQDPAIWSLCRRGCGGRPHSRGAPVQQRCIAAQCLQ